MITFLAWCASLSVLFIYCFNLRISLVSRINAFFYVFIRCCCWSSLLGVFLAFGKLNCHASHNFSLSPKSKLINDLNECLFVCFFFYIILDTSSYVRRQFNLLFARRGVLCLRMSNGCLFMDLFICWFFPHLREITNEHWSADESKENNFSAIINKNRIENWHFDEVLCVDYISSSSLTIGYDLTLGLSLSVEIFRLSSSLKCETVKYNYLPMEQKHN